MKDPEKMPDGSVIVHFNVGVLPSQLSPGQESDLRPGCEQRPCFRCNAAVWLSPEALAMSERIPVCEPCALRLASEKMLDPRAGVIVTEDSEL